LKDARLLIHLGFPKTASTTMQSRLFADLENEGHANLLTWRKLDPKESHDNRPNSRLFMNTEMGIAYTSMSEKRVNILSDESFTAPLRLRQNNFGPGASDPLSFPRKIRDQILASNKNLRVSMSCLIVIRNQSSLIYSQYVEEYNLKKFKGIDLLFDADGQVDLSGYEVYSYHRYFNELEQIFGSDNVHLLFFEDLINTPLSFYRQLAEILEVQESKVETAFLEAKHNEKRKGAVGYWTEGQGELVPYFTEEQKEKIKNWFYKDNERPMHQIGHREKFLKYGYL
jgi:hypothetical protein